MAFYGLVRVRTDLVVSFRKMEARFAQISRAISISVREKWVRVNRRSERMQGPMWLIFGYVGPKGISNGTSVLKIGNRLTRSRENTVGKGQNLNGNSCYKKESLRLCSLSTRNNNFSVLQTQPLASKLYPLS